MIKENTSLLRIGVFYDGNYFYHVSNYYNYVHERKSRISIAGLHDFIEDYAAKLDGVDPSLCQIVDSHYFRGRVSAKEASQRGNQLYHDRVFDDVLMSEGVITHYLPVRYTGGRKEEKGIDVWMALEAYELTLHKRFDILVIVASDGDYVPLARKVNTLGTRVMVLSWDFEYTDDEGRNMVTRTSQDLLEEVSYPVAMHEVIDNRMRKGESIINNLFVKPESLKKFQPPPVSSDDIYESEVLSIKNGYGFIKYPPNNLFFYYGDLEDADFNDINEGDLVEFVIGKNSEGEYVAKKVKRIYDDDEERQYIDDEVETEEEEEEQS